MGAWGFGDFENDSALDWAEELIEDENKIEFIESTLKKALSLKTNSLFKKLINNKEKQIEEPLGSEILAASEIIAALNNNPSNDLPDFVTEWINSNRFNNLTSLKLLALEAINIVKTKSELKELWNESEDLSNWLKIICELEERLR